MHGGVPRWCRRGVHGPGTTHPGYTSSLLLGHPPPCSWDTLIPAENRVIPAENRVIPEQKRSFLSRRWSFLSKSGHSWVIFWLKVVIPGLPGHSCSSGLPGPLSSGVNHLMAQSHHFCHFCHFAVIKYLTPEESEDRRPLNAVLSKSSKSDKSVINSTRCSSVIWPAHAYRQLLQGR